jgi:hypothetical protein
MSEWMFCEVEGYTFRKSASPESDVVLFKHDDDFITAFADLHVGADADKFHVACENFVRRIKNGTKKVSKPVEEDSVEIEGESIDI